MQFKTKNQSHTTKKKIYLKNIKIMQLKKKQKSISCPQKLKINFIKLKIKKSIICIPKK